MKYVNFSDRNGNLAIYLLPEGREFIEEAKADGKNIDADAFFLDLIEHQLCNGWATLEPFAVGALTDSVILSEDVGRNDEGEITNVGRAYWFPNYQVESPVATLLEKGEVIFTGVD